MSLEISIRINDGKEPLSSLGRAAREFSENSKTCKHNGECDDCGCDCPDCEVGCKSTLGAKAKEFSRMKDALGVYDLKKRDLSNEYAPQEETGKRQK